MALERRGIRGINPETGMIVVRNGFDVSDNYTSRKALIDKHLGYFARLAHLEVSEILKKIVPRDTDSRHPEIFKELIATVSLREEQRTPPPPLRTVHFPRITRDQCSLLIEKLASSPLPLRMYTWEEAGAVYEPHPDDYPIQ